MIELKNSSDLKKKVLNNLKISNFKSEILLSSSINLLKLQNKQMKAFHKK